MKTNMTVKTTNAYEEMMRDFNGANKSTLTIAPEVIAQAIENGYITEIARKNGHKHVNIYYEFTCEWLDGLQGQILLHVSNDQYVLLSRMVEMEDYYLSVDVIPYLATCSFSVQATTENKERKLVMAEGSRYIHRMLISLAKYGEIRSLDRTYDVHHKGGTFDERQQMTMYIPRKLHKHSTSHMTGREIKSFDEFMYFCGDMSRQYEELKDFNEVA